MAAPRPAPTSLMLDPELVSELKAVAIENERSLSAQARVALREWLDHAYEGGEPATPQSPRPAPRQETS